MTEDGSFTVQIREIPKTGGAKLEYRSWNARTSRPSWVEERGYEFIQTGRLEVTLLGVRGYGGATYRDARTHQVYHRLGVFFYDLEVARLYRAHASRERERAKQERARAWEAAMQKAKARFREDARLDHIRALGDAARRAEEARTFARAAQAAITSLDGDAQVEAQAALELFVLRSDDKDPLRHPELFVSSIPEPTSEELKPYLGRWSPYSPGGG